MSAKSNLKIGEPCIHRAVTPETFRGGHWENKVELRGVTLLALAGCWAMVRRKACMPYVVHVKHLEAEAKPKALKDG